AAYARPPLATIDMNLELVGRKAAQLLFAAMEGTASPGVHTIPTSLIPRDSTAF
ncbi:substrate-binding domain-containing protein, partial [Escherichia coli]|uniref:substrate-binding domain-containing protein n=1 Tax=Escherichia coli TaxID=562 RepID=UPI003D9C24C9